MNVHQVADVKATEVLVVVYNTDITCLTSFKCDLFDLIQKSAVATPDGKSRKKKKKTSFKCELRKTLC